MIGIGLYLIVALAMPLYAMRSKAFIAYHFDLSQYEVQVSDNTGNFGPVQSLESLNAEGVLGRLATNTNSRLGLTKLFPDFSFRSPVTYRFRGTSQGAVYQIGSERTTGPEWVELDSNTFCRVVIRPVSVRGFANFKTYFSTPVFFQSVQNSLLIAIITTVIAFGIDRRMRKIQVALLTARSVVCEPKPNGRMDWFFFGFAMVIPPFFMGSACRITRLVSVS